MGGGRNHEGPLDGQGDTASLVDSILDIIKDARKMNEDER